MLNHLKSIFFTLILCTLIVFLNKKGISQNISDSLIFCPLIKVSFAVQQPGGDLATSFGPNINIGVSAGIKSKNNSTIELEYEFIHSKNVTNTDILDHLMNSQGWIINQYGEENLYVMYERGGLAGFNIGKIWSVIGPNPNSGIHFKAGFGGIYHKIRIENQDNLIPQLKKEHLKYYDRLTMGLYTKQYIGYHHMNNNKLINFTVGFECIEGFTKGMRDYQIDLMGPYIDRRLDLYFGVRIGWVFPVFRQEPNDYYYN